jgi:hypothetical protein
MIDFELLENRGLIELRPHPPLTRGDFTKVAADLDDYLASRGRLKGLLVIAPEFPGWKDFAALRTHFEFISQHHRKISRVAIVSDSPTLKMMPKLARHFVDAELRTFPMAGRDEAADWLAGGDDLPRPSGIRFLRFQSRPLMWVEIDGRVTREDYALLAESMRQQIEESGSISFLIRLRQIDGVEPGVVWDDLKFTLGNLGKMGRIAVVGDKRWAAWLARTGDALTPAEVRHFPSEHEETAWDWLGMENPAKPQVRSGIPKHSD